jgi:hypothetical protein
MEVVDSSQVQEPLFRTDVPLVKGNHVTNLITMNREIKACSGGQCLDAQAGRGRG